MLSFLAITVFSGMATYLILRRAGGIGRTIVSCAVGVVLALGFAVVLFVGVQLVWGVPAEQADRVFGAGVLAAMIGPAIGALAAARGRRRRVAHP